MSDPTVITVGSHLFCAAKPSLLPGTFLSSGEFGRRQLEKPIIRKEEKQGEELGACFGLGPLASHIFDLSKPRRVSTVDPFGTVMVLGELVWEVVRLREFPHRPSRLDCLFFWQQETRGRAWFSDRTWPSSLYEVEVVECHRVFVANLGKIQFGSEDGTIATMMEQARQYWAESGYNSSNPEVLLEGRVSVIASIETRA